MIKSPGKVTLADVPQDLDVIDEQDGVLWAGDLCLRLAQNRDEIRAAQALRYKIFYREMNARPTPEMAHTQRDFDRLDDVCDHLLVIDTNRAGGDAVVGTYRLITRPVAMRNGGFYSASEYDVSCIEAYPGEVLELGRSCVDAAYRNGTTMQLLWRGIANYAFANGIDLLFGCASLHGTDVQQLQLQLAYLYHYHLSDPDLRPVALKDRFVDMNMLDKDDIDIKQATLELPPLLKGYLRVGAKIGLGAVVDWQFGTTDVCIILKTELMSGKYAKHYRRSNPEPQQIM